MTDLTPQQRRLAALRAGLDAQGLAGALLSQPEHLFYFTGAWPEGSPAFLIVRPERAMAVAQAPLGELETVTYSPHDLQDAWSVASAASQALNEGLAQSGLRDGDLGIEAEHLPAAFLAVARRFGEARGIGDLLWRLRCRKDSAELAQIEANVAGNDRAFAALQRAIRPGMTDIELWSLLYGEMCRSAGGPVALEADLGANPSNSNPDAKPTGAGLAQGDFVFVDLYSATRGYYADTTRVFSLGEPSARQREVHSILEEALAAGEAALRPGVAACEVDAAVRGRIERAGYGPHFPHHSGHAYGLFQQERPYIIPTETMPLEEGMILTLEPGLYFEGWGGMRLEGNWVITASGARRLDRFPSQLAVCAG